MNTMNKINVTVTSEPWMQNDKNNKPYVAFHAVESSAEGSPKAYWVIVYNETTMQHAYLYLHKGDKVTLEGKLKPSDKPEQRFIMKHIGADFLQRIYS